MSIVGDWGLISARWVEVRQAERFKPYHAVATTPLLAICASRVRSVALIRRALAAIIRSCTFVTALHGRSRPCEIFVVIYVYCLSFTLWAKLYYMSTTQYQVLVRNGSRDLFVASVLGMSDCVGEGRTREEAIAKAKAALVDRLARGEIVTIDVESNDTVSASNIWREQAGRFHDDSTFDEFVAEIQSERRDLDSEESAS